MAFLRTLVLACAVAHCAAFNPSVGTLGRFGSLKKSVSYTQTKAAPLRTAPKASSRRAAASDISMGYNVDLTGKVRLRLRCKQV